MNISTILLITTWIIITYIAGLIHGYRISTKQKDPLQNALQTLIQNNIERIRTEQKTQNKTKNSIKKDYIN